MIRAAAVVALLALCAGAEAAPRVRSVRTLQGGTWTIRETAARPKQCQPARLEITARQPGKPPATRAFSGLCERRKGDEPGAFSTWRFFERVDVGGHTFLILENDDAAADHRSVDYWLFDAACGAILEVGKLKSVWGFEYDGKTTGSLGSLVEAKGDAAARWQKLAAPGFDVHWSAALCKFEPDE